MFFNKQLSILLLVLLYFLAWLPHSYALLGNDLSDDQISTAIESNLIIDEGVSSHLIDVSTQNGIVTLSGTVGNLLAKERALKITQTIRGVRTIINKIAVAPVKRSNENIQKDIKKALRWDPATDSNEVDVEVNNGLVTLKGNADSWQEKQLASEVAKGVSGVTEINNEIAFILKLNRPDDEIKADILRRLESNIWISETFIQASVNEGNVKLTGTVGNVAERKRAGLLAWVSGVKKVDNSDLKVNPRIDDETERINKASFKSDDEIETSIEEAFLYDFRVNPFNLKVEVDHGYATLSGVVDNMKAKRSAEMDAKHTRGVWGVNNNLKVRPKGAPNDSEIAEYVKGALAFHPLVDRYDITVRVRNKKVHLYGTVDTAFDKKRVDDVVSRIDGVAEVNNRLAIHNSWPYRNDHQIKNKIEQEFWWSIHVDEEDILVDVHNGKVRLSGQVDSWNELRASVRNAFEGGARSVETHLKTSADPEKLFVQNHYSYNDLDIWP